MVHAELLLLAPVVWLAGMVICVRLVTWATERWTRTSEDTAEEAV